MSTGRGRARQIVLWLLSFQLVVLVGTGVYLYFRYRPTASQAWSIPGVSGDVTLAQRVRIVHRLTSYLLPLTGMAAFLLLTVGEERVFRFRRGIAATISFPVVALGASMTGSLLAWDQISMWAVEVGSHASGFGILRSDNVKFVLIGGAQVDPSTILRWLVVHVAAGAVLVALAAVGWRRVLARHERPSS